MATLAMNYVVNPFASFWNGFKRFTEVAGYARAASYLATHGYHNEARSCMMEIKKLRS